MFPEGQFAGALARQVADRDLSFTSGVDGSTTLYRLSALHESKRVICGTSSPLTYYQRLTVFAAMYSHQPYPYDFPFFQPVQSFLDTELANVPEIRISLDNQGRERLLDPIDDE